MELGDVEERLQAVVVRGGGMRERERVVGRAMCLVCRWLDTHQNNPDV